jgi:hypothetical protein
LPKELHSKGGFDIGALPLELGLWMEAVVLLLWLKRKLSGYTEARNMRYTDLDMLKVGKG